MHRFHRGVAARSRLGRVLGLVSLGLLPFVLAVWLVRPSVPPVAAQGVLVAFDDFSDASSGWMIEDVAQRAFGYGAGGYFARIKVANYGGYGWWKRNASDFDVRVRVRRIGFNNGKNGEAYLAFRIQASARYYAFMINDEEKYCNLAIYNGSLKNTFFDNCKDHVRNLPDWNTLRVVAKGRDLTFYLNDAEVGKVNDGSYSSGYFGLGAGSLGSSVGYEALFDDFALYEDSGQAVRTPTPSPTATATPTRTYTPVPAISPTSSATPRIPPRTRSATPTETVAVTRPPEPTTTPSPRPIEPSSTPDVGIGGGKAFMPALLKNGVW